MVDPVVVERAEHEALRRLYEHGDSRTGYEPPARAGRRDR